MDLMEQIKSNIDPSRYQLPDFVWNSLILNSRIRFHSFFRHFGNLKDEESMALREYRPNIKNIKEFFVTIIKYNLISFKFRKRKEDLLQKLSSKEIIIHKTFCYISSFENGKFKDPFFLSFTEKLTSHDNYLIIVDPLMKYEGIAKLRNLKNINILPWYSFLTPSDYIRALATQLKYFFLFGATKTSWDKEYKQELIHPTTFNHLLFYFAFKKISKKFKTKRFILTFENNSWEKVAIQAFRENSPKTIIAGYQHSVVPESTIGMRYLPWEMKNNRLPDLIFTTGLETENILKSFNPNLGIPIKALCALRYEYLFQMPKKTNILTKKILVAVDAIIEAKELINIVIDLKNYFIENQYAVTFRFHPAMPYTFFKNLIDYKNLEEFASVSTISLSEDIKNHDCVIYWGSTVSMESSFCGNALVNFQSPFPLSHDPLFRCEHLKWKVKDSSELKTALDEIYKLNLDFINLERSEIKKFIENYFYKPTDENLNTLLGS